MPSPSFFVQTLLGALRQRSSRCCLRGISFRPEGAVPNRGGLGSRMQPELTEKYILAWNLRFGHLTGSGKGR